MSKKRKKNIFLYIFENYLLRVMSLQSFSFIRFVDEKLTWGVISPPSRENNVHKKARE